MPSLTVTREPVLQVEVLALIRQSDAVSASLYAPEVRYGIDVDALSRPGVRFVVARRNGSALGCGALILNPDGTAELKRMFVSGDARGFGVGRAILEALESEARAAEVERILIETGVRNAEALSLYRSSGYRRRGPFGRYPDHPESVFLEKCVPQDPSISMP